MLRIMKTIYKILGISAIASVILGGNLALAQRRNFFFPSASFFSPTAAFMESEDTVFGSLSGMKQHKTFYSHLKSTNLIEELSGKNLTALVPTDRAFNNLPADVKTKLDDPEKLEQLLKYHFVAGKITEEDIKRQAVATVLDKTSVSITGIPVGDRIGVKLNDATATEPTPMFDGVIIPLDSVLIPPGF